MANYTVNAGHRSVGPFTVTTGGDTVTFADKGGRVEVVNPSSVDLYASTVSAPTVPAAGASSPALRIPGGMALEVPLGESGSVYLVAASDAAGVSVQRS